ncbi:recA DNA recombination family protein [Actinidia rufa]|uniref:RecA DNA recombination family protein n=1 Tax=Actinidia rufa TaxID=165716 RepID=A0A7J0GPB2_9ERIC|nr:recA DNA recombination family protein [Actinidia rufa]
MNDINNSFGKGSVTSLGSAGGALVETFPSGCLTLDFALGGGLPKGRIVEIYGPESGGKTTLGLHAIAEVQKAGGNAMLVDAEHAFDPAYSKALGVDVENLIIPVSALTPRAEIEIGVYYGNPEVTSGGIALKFFASLRLEIHPIGKIKSAKGDEDVGLKVRVRVQKSKGCGLSALLPLRVILGIKA